MTGPQNSPVSDPVPFQPPDNTPKVNKIPPSDWRKLGNSRKYKSVDAYIEARKEYFRHWLPGGQALAELAATDPIKAGQYAGVASTIVDELESLQFKIQRETSK